MVGQSGTAVAGALGAWLRRQSSSRVPSIRLRPCPPRPRCVAKQIKLQVALITPLIHVKGYAAPETKAAAERARLLIEQAEALGEPPEDPLLLFSVLYGFWVANFVAFNGDVVRELAAQFLALAEKQGATVPLMIGHRLLGTVLASYGRHRGRPGALRSGDCALRSCRASSRWRRDLAKTSGCAILSYRSLALWMLGYPEAALADIEHAVKHAREIGQAATLMYALNVTSLILHLLRKLRGSKRAMPKSLSLWRRRREALFLEGVRNAAPRLRVGPDRQSLGRGPR